MIIALKVPYVRDIIGWQATMPSAVAVWGVGGKEAGIKIAPKIHSHPVRIYLDQALDRYHCELAYGGTTVATVATNLTSSFGPNQSIYLCPASPP
jgi:hypothetical protein